MKRRIFKWLLRVALAVVALVVLLFAFKNSILRVVAERRIRDETGMRAEIGRMSSGIFALVVTIENLKLYNTAAFGGAPFLTIPELHLECDCNALKQGKLRLSLMRLNLSDVSIVRNELGQTNVFDLLTHLEKKHPKRDKKKGDHWLEFEGIDELQISLGTARYVDLKNPAADRDWHINLTNQVVKNVRSDDDLYGLAVIIWLRSGGEINFPMPTLTTDALGLNPRLTKTNKVHKAKPQSN